MFYGDMKVIEEGGGNIAWMNQIVVCFSVPSFPMLPCNLSCRTTSPATLSSAHFHRDTVCFTRSDLFFLAEKSTAHLS